MFRPSKIKEEDDDEEGAGQDEGDGGAEGGKGTAIQKPSLFMPGAWCLTLHLLMFTTIFREHFS